ncbi:MAG: disulfide oxidoreductase [Candidatus Magasanikiibacteriota bacterium]
MTLLQFINPIFSVLTVLGQVFIIITVITLIFFRKKQNIFFNFINQKALLLSFIIALVTTLGSLFYSEIAKFNPCHLCWFQRIFMYPQVILLGLAYWKKDYNIIDYSLSLIGLGTIFSLYHNYIYYVGTLSATCSLDTPCTAPYIVGFGYISIPLMALTAFLMIGLLLINKKVK